jgi:hypothetical protein
MEIRALPWESVMSHERIASWLGLPPGPWPPDHYTLLGLTPGESDVQRIEQQVHERLARVRQQQLANPEQATDAMNRIAQAFVCLTDAKAKQAYDAQLLGRLPPLEALPAPEVEAPLVPVKEEPPLALAVEESADPLAWLFGPWNGMAGQAPTPPRKDDTQVILDPTRIGNGHPQPTVIDWKPGDGQAPPLPPAVRAAAAPTPEALVALPAPDPVAAPVVAPADQALAAPPAPPLEPEPVDPLVRLARKSPRARQGIGTKRALYNRVARTRELLGAWEQVGKYIKARQRLTRRSEASDLVRQLSTIREVLKEFPPLLGEAGQPGYLVIALARQQTIVQTFQALLPSQREILARDWESGHTLLTAHRQFLRQELRALRKRSFLGRSFRAAEAAVDEHPGLVLLGLAVLALALALWRTLFP